jgi:BolA protein
METKIREKLEAAFQPVHIVLENESHQHSVPSGSESHFRLVLVSARFEGLMRVSRQRLINEALRDELSGGLHALTMRALTPHEWSEAGGVVEANSPPCYGGSKNR